MNIGKVSSELDWIIPTDFPEQFRLEGFPWFQENQGFIRLPKRLSKTFRAPVWELAHCCSGGQLHFATNSPTVNIRVKIPTAQKGTEHLPGPGEMYHMPATGQSGFDLYEKHDDHYEFLGISRFEVKKYSYESELKSFETSIQRNFVLNFPLYSGVETLEIGLEKNSIIYSPALRHSSRPIIIYGTSVTQGGCANRPGMSYTNIMSRILDTEIINLGFSGNGKGDIEVANAITEIPSPRMILLDYEGNAGSPAEYANSLPPFLAKLREYYPQTPIGILGRFPFANEYRKLSSSRLENRKMVTDLVEAQQNELTFFIDCSEAFGAYTNEATVDGVHPTDLGFMLLGEYVSNAIVSYIQQK